MKFIPAIDLKDNKCVRLRQGKEENITIFNDNPVDQAKFFEKNGCKRIHIVDLDAAFGRVKNNSEVILEIRKNIKIEIELGGGIKEEKDILFWFESGIDYVVIGSLAIKNKNTVFGIANKFKNKIYVALDVLEKKIMIKGWLEDSKVAVESILNFYNNSMIRGFILTDISRDGMLDGLNINLINSFVSKTKKEVIVGGGLAHYKDLHELKKIKFTNLSGVISGKSFYTGNIQINKALDILSKDA